MRSLAKKDPRSFFEKHDKSLLIGFCCVALVMFLLFSFLLAMPSPYSLLGGI